MPDDPLMKVILRRITKNDENFIAIKQERAGAGGGAGKPVEILPMGSSVASERNSELLSEEERHALEDALKMAGITGVSPLQLKKVIALAGYANAKEIQQLQQQPQLTPSQEEERLRDEIEEHVREFARKNGKEPREINAKIVQHFGKSRTRMTLPELRKVVGWMKSALPTNMLFG